MGSLKIALLLLASIVASCSAAGYRQFLNFQTFTVVPGQCNFINDFYYTSNNLKFAGFGAYTVDTSNVVAIIGAINPCIFGLGPTNSQKATIKFVKPATWVEFKLAVRAINFPSNYLKITTLDVNGKSLETKTIDATKNSDSTISFQKAGIKTVQFDFSLYKGNSARLDNLRWEVPTSTVSSCSADSDCPQPYFRCSSGKCVCRSGFTGSDCKTCTTGTVISDGQGKPFCASQFQCFRVADCPDNGYWQCNGATTTSPGNCDCKNGFSGQDNDGVKTCATCNGIVGQDQTGPICPAKCRNDADCGGGTFAYCNGFVCQCRQDFFGRDCRQCAKVVVVDKVSNIAKCVPCKVDKECPSEGYYFQCQQGFCQCRNSFSGDDCRQCPKNYHEERDEDTQLPACARDNTCSTDQDCSGGNYFQCLSGQCQCRQGFNGKDCRTCQGTTVWNGNFASCRPQGQCDADQDCGDTARQYCSPHAPGQFGSCQCRRGFQGNDCKTCTDPGKEVSNGNSLECLYYPDCRYDWMCRSGEKCKNITPANPGSCQK